MSIEEHHISDRGRRRRRTIRVDLDEVRRGLEIPSAADLAAWRQIRSQLKRHVGEDTFAIWLEPLELIAIDSDQRLVLVAPAAMAAWTSSRFGRLMATTASETGRDARFANAVERQALGADATSEPIHINPKEAAG